MRITSTTSPRPRSGRALTRALAATAGLGLALSLTACTIGEASDDDDTAAATTQQTSASESAAPAEEPADSGDTMPGAPVDELVLNAADAPELGLQPVPAEEIAGGLSLVDSITEGVTVEPAHCADFNQESLLEQTAPGTMAIQSGQAGDTVVAVAVTTLADELPERANEVENCPVMTVTMPIEGMELVTESTNTLLDLEAPEGVRDFSAVRQDSSANVMGQTVTTGNLMITGAIRGIAVSVTATSPTGEITPEIQATAMDTFTKQVAKIRDAA